LARTAIAYAFAVYPHAAGTKGAYVDDSAVLAAVLDADHGDNDRDLSDGDFEQTLVLYSAGASLHRSQTFVWIQSIQLTVVCGDGFTVIPSRFHLAMLCGRVVLAFGQILFWVGVWCSYRSRNQAIVGFVFPILYFGPPVMDSFP
jgi:hypothetical protein